MPTLPAIRIAHIADTHLGYRAANKIDPETERNQRSVDFELAFARTIDGILEAKPDIVVHAGDVFHHTRPTWHAISVFVRQMRRLEEARIPAVVITGNHDSPRLRTGGTVFTVLKLSLPEITFVTDYEIERHPFPDLGLTVHAIPHGAIALNLYDPVAYADSGVRNLLLLHGMIPGMDDFAHYEPGSEEIANDLLDASFSYIALGHYHVQMQARANAWYAGSTERTGWGDEDVHPGFLTVDFPEGELSPHEVAHQPIEARALRTLEPINGAGMTAPDIISVIRKRLDRIDDPRTMTRIELRETPRPIRREVDQLIKRELADRVWSLETYVPGAFLARTESPAAVDTDVSDIRSLFEQFVEERETSGAYDAIFAAAFRDRGRVALNHAIEDVTQALAEDRG